MNKEIESFQESIRRTFIVFSLAPVIGIVFAVMIVFVVSWSAYMGESNRRDNEEIASEANAVLSGYYSMVVDVKNIMDKSGSDAENVKNRIYAKLYDSTSAYDELGTLMILSGEGEVLFTSGSRQEVPSALTDPELMDWGVWNRIKAKPGLTNTILFEGTLYVTFGEYKNGSLDFAIVYAVPSQVIADIINKRSRYCIVTDENGWIYLNNTQGLKDELGQIRGVFERHSGYVRSGGQKYICYESSLAKGLRVYTFYDINRSLRMILLLMAIILVIFIAIIFITYRSTATSSEKYTRDVKKIEDAFEAVQQGDLDVSLNIDSNREFQTIGNDFNEMLDGLKEQIERNKELAENAAFSQVKQLESQFNPHFLFNTLDNIRFMARIDAAAADKMIVSLSGLLRYSIKDMREEVTVREDLDNLQYYLNILQIRFNKRFAYNINVAEDIRECLIPKLLLQPLLENAVKYGFGEKEKLTVNISGYQIKESLIFVCEDDGVGIDEDVLGGLKAQLENSDNTSGHFGLYNIHRRIQLMYKEDYGLELNSKKGEGTMVRLTLPKRIQS
ncbi:MAG: histidine kinase [Butyrivibrio sp.]|nr:histidine kinase [Butyrivibrio sp.]